MSKEQPSATTRRAFLGTATVATAASLTGPMAAADQSTDRPDPARTIKLAEANVDVPEQLAARAKAGDWTKPAAMAIPKEGYFKPEQGRYGPIFPKTPANYGFTIIAKIKPGREEAVRAYGKTIETAIAGDPYVLAPLKLHYLRWVLFNIGSDTYFMYQGIFDTDFDKYTRMQSLSSNKPGSIQSSKILRASRWIGRRTLRHSLNSCANINARAFSNMVSIRSSPPTK